LALHDQAHHMCFIARSVNFPVETEAELVEAAGEVRCSAWAGYRPARRPVKSRAVRKRCAPLPLLRLQSPGTSTDPTVFRCRDHRQKRRFPSTIRKH